MLHRFYISLYEQEIVKWRGFVFVSMVLQTLTEHEEINNTSLYFELFYQISHSRPLGSTLTWWKKWNHFLQIRWEWFWYSSWRSRSRRHFSGIYLEYLGNSAIELRGLREAQGHDFGIFHQGLGAPANYQGFSMRGSQRMWVVLWNG